jgi:hypothetical protein
MANLAVRLETRRGDLFSALIDANAITEFHSRIYSPLLSASRVSGSQFSRQDGTASGISANLLQLTGSGNMPKRFVYNLKCFLTPSMKIKSVFWTV